MHFLLLDTFWELFFDNMSELEVKNKLDDLRNYIISEYCCVDQAKILHLEIKKYEKMLEKLKKPQ